MKNLIFLFWLTLFIGTNSYSQINMSQKGVGINKPAPTTGLDIKGGNGFNLKIDNGGEQYTDIELLNNGTRRGLLEIDKVGNVFRIISEKADQDFSIQTGGFNDRLRINPSGQIGIGMQSWQDYKVTINADNVLNPFVLYNDKNQLSLIDFWNVSTGTNAGISNRFVTNKPNAINTWNVASIDKYRTGLWAFRNYDSNGRIEFDLQGIAGNTTPELVIENDGGVKIPSAGIKFGGTAIAGSMRWTGTDFEGYNGSQWKSLINNQGPPSGYWASANSSNSCTNICATGYAAGATVDGNICMGNGGVTSNSVTYQWFNAFSPTANRFYDYQAYSCGYQSLLTQCYCVRVTN